MAVEAARRGQHVAVHVGLQGVLDLGDLGRGEEPRDPHEAVGGEGLSDGLVAQGRAHGGEVLRLGGRCHREIGPVAGSVAGWG